VKPKSDKGNHNEENRWAFVTNLPQYNYGQVQVAEPCTYPNCDGIKLPDGTGWRCSKCGRYHYFWVKAQLIRKLQKAFYAMPLESFKDPAFQYFEHLRRNVKRDGIKELPQQVLL